ncbi:hypothetical protein ACJX0J_011205, partial [Zea mays]
VMSISELDLDTKILVIILNLINQDVSNSGLLDAELKGSWPKTLSAEWKDFTYIVQYDYIMSATGTGMLTPRFVISDKWATLRIATLLGWAKLISKYLMWAIYLILADQSNIIIIILHGIYRFIQPEMKDISDRDEEIEVLLLAP